MAAKRSVLITGCSQGGLGDSLARAFHDTGFRVFATARNPKKMAHFQSLNIETIVLDVQSQESINAAVTQVSQLTGGTLDALVNNSGVGYMIPVADADLSRVKDMFDVNVISNIAMIQAFLPLLRAAAPGSMIINNTSIASILSFPLQAFYSGTKAAMAAINDSMRVELAPFGIKVIELKTGSVNTNFFENSGKAASSENTAKLPSNSIYGLARDTVEEQMNGKSVMEGAEQPDVWAKQVVTDLTRTSPPARIWRGHHSLVAWFVRSFLPHTTTDGPAAKMSGMDVFTQKLKDAKKEV